MYESASKENRVVTTALTVTYKTERRYETLPDGTLRYWYKVTRSAAKDYRYVNMTEKAAILAAASKAELYTRQTRKNISRTLDKVCPSLTTSVQPEFNACGSWDVVINVNETDSTHSDTLPADPAALFTEENARDYDEGEAGIVLTSNSAGMESEPPTWLLNLDLTAKVTKGDPSNVRFWLKEPIDTEFYDITDDGRATITVDGDVVHFTMTLGPYYSYYGDLFEQKATLGQIESNIEPVSSWN